MKKPIPGQMSLSSQGESFYTPETARKLFSEFGALLSDESRVPLTKEEQEKTLLSGRDENYRLIEPIDMLNIALEKSLRRTDLDGKDSEYVKTVMQRNRFAITKDKIDEVSEAQGIEAQRLVPFTKIRPNEPDGKMYEDDVEMFLKDLENKTGFYDDWQLFIKILTDETQDETRSDKISKFIEDAVSSRNFGHMSFLISTADDTFSKRYNWFGNQKEKYMTASAELRDEINIKLSQ
jgi:hypothetical protein